MAKQPKVKMIQRRSLMSIVSDQILRTRTRLRLKTILKRRRNRRVTMMSLAKRARMVLSLKNLKKS